MCHQTLMMLENEMVDLVVRATKEKKIVKRNYFPHFIAVRWIISLVTHTLGRTEVIKCTNIHIYMFLFNEKLIIWINM